MSDVEGYSHVVATAERRKGNEGVLLKQIIFPDYYSQWQKMPGHPLKWQVDLRQTAYEARRMVADMVKKNSKSILDVGCGIGLDYDYYKDSEVRYYGVDITPKFVDAARQRGVPAEVGDVLNLRFKDGEFDTVYCKDLLIHLTPGDWRVALKEMARVARIQVVTLEDNWSNRTVYSLREKHASYDEENHDFEMLMFFHNEYGNADFREYAHVLGLQVQIFHPELSAPILNGDQFIRTGQITVYTKDRS